MSDLADVRLVHLISGLDEGMPAAGGDAASPTVITGYTEWISDTEPVLTIGWDWQMNTHQLPVQLQRIDVPRSNLMIQDSSANDLGQDKAATLLEQYVDSLDWQDTTLAHITARYTTPD